MENEIAFTNHENAFEVARKLIEENYVVMISQEEQLYIVNYIWSPNGDRNDVVFMDRCIHEDLFWEKATEEESDFDPNTSMFD